MPMPSKQLYLKEYAVRAISEKGIVRWAIPAFIECLIHQLIPIYGNIPVKLITLRFN